ncbi:MAG: ATP-binding cassette domain-containing protein [Clostridiales bacterium]|nr:ATP-binding cassette domain-containing protein [Clostridiales bacterium]
MSIDVAIKKKIGNFFLDTTFQTEENEVFAILGASGCGKSMTLKCIAGIETPDEGHIILNGKTLFDSAKKINLIPQKRRVGYMFQDYALFPNMTVEKNIMAGMGKHPNPAIVQTYIERFHLDGLTNHLPRQLSGGQKQRVALARMLASEPEILLLDEPLSALDTYLKWQVEEELAELFTGIQKTILFVTHSRDEVYHLCDRVCVLSNGHVETIQPKKDFFANPETISAARLSGCRNFSRAERISAHEIFAPDWQMRFVLEREVPEDLAYVGARAHYIEVISDTSGTAIPKVGPTSVEDEDNTHNIGSAPVKTRGDAIPANCAVMQVDHLMEQQFESELILNCGDESGTQMRLLMDKGRALELSGQEKLEIRIPEAALLLLRE